MEIKQYPSGLKPDQLGHGRFDYIDNNYNGHIDYDWDEALTRADIDSRDGEINHDMPITPDMGNAAVADFIPLVDPEEWKKRAECRDKDTNVFFPDNPEDSKRAQGICLHCPVIAECLKYAMDKELQGHDDTKNVDPKIHGVWGGTNATDRSRSYRIARLAQKMK